MSNILFHSATQLARMVREQEISATELLNEQLSHIRKHNPDLNAIVMLDEEHATQRAQEADQAQTQGVVWGPLHGVPVTVKDAYDYVGLRSTFGFKTNWYNRMGQYKKMEAYKPERNSTIVDRLLGSGAIIVGKTNMPEFAFDWQTYNQVFGRTNNPWNLEYTPGGSSGGCGAAVSAGLSPLSMGSDASGSIRFPAHCCGIFGFKPTAHLVSGAGHLELPGRIRPMLLTATYGPLARSVDDLRLAVSIIAGPDGRHWEVPPVPLDTPNTKPLRECRFAWCDDFGGVPVAAETRAAITKLAETLEGIGCHVEKMNPPNFDPEEALLMWGETMGFDLGIGSSTVLNYVAVRPWFRRRYGDSAWTRGLLSGMRLKPRRLFKALTRRDSLIDAMETFLLGWDAWLCPVASIPSFRHCRTGTPLDVDGKRVEYTVGLGIYLTPLNLTGNPAVVVPLTQSREGLPIGIQVVGRRWHDMHLLNLAEQITEVIGPWKSPPGY